MNLVLTGSSGFLGRAVLARLAGPDHHILAVDRVPHEGPALPGVTHHQADLTDPAAINHHEHAQSSTPAISNPKSKIQNPKSKIPFAPSPFHPFTLISLAWDLRRHLGFANQAEQVRLLAGQLDYWESCGLEHVIFMGSAEEFGPRSGKIAGGDPPVLPLSPYGWAKRAARDMLASWSLRTGIPVTIIRPFIMYGPGQGGDMLIPSAVAAARQKTRTAFTDGKQVRDFVFIDDVAEAIALAAEKRPEEFCELNLGGGQGMLVADVLMDIARAFDAATYFVLGARPRRPNEPDEQIADISEAERKLGWRPRVGWTEGLRRIKG
jgi:nucleoside-diphosphate-sugar epimerase